MPLAFICFIWVTCRIQSSHREKKELGLETSSVTPFFSRFHIHWVFLAWGIFFYAVLILQTIENMKKSEWWVNIAAIGSLIFYHPKPNKILVISMAKFQKIDNNHQYFIWVWQKKLIFQTSIFFPWVKRMKNSTIQLFNSDKQWPRNPQNFGIH